MNWRRGLLLLNDSMLSLASARENHWATSSASLRSASATLAIRQEPDPGPLFLSRAGRNPLSPAP